MDPGALGAAFARAEPGWLLVAGLAYAAAHTASAMVWRVGLRRGGCAVGARDVLVAHWVARGACEVVPGHLGEAARLAVIRRHPAAAAAGDLRVAGTMGAWKLLDGMVTFLVVMLAALVIPLPPGFGGARWVAGGLALGTAVAAVTMSRWDLPALAAGRRGRLGRLLRPLARGAGLLSCPRAMAAAAGLQLLFIALRVSSLAALLLAFGVPGGAAPLVFTLMILTGYLAISPGGVGVREAALVPALVAAHGLTVDHAVAVSLGVQATSLVVSLAGCALALAAVRVRPAAAQGRRMRNRPTGIPATFETPLHSPSPAAVSSSAIIASGAR